MGGTGSGRWDFYTRKTTTEECEVVDIRRLHRRKDFLTEASRNLDGVNITWTRCHFGGKRPWFICKCGRRVAILYSKGCGCFRCRLCKELVYKSQREARWLRALSRAQAIWSRLGWHFLFVFSEYFYRPKGMHWRTYFFLLEKHEKEMKLFEHLFSIKMAQIHKRIDRLTSIVKPGGVKSAD